MVAEIRRMLTDYLLLEETPALFEQWFQLVASADVRGRSVYDARLVAAMYVHRVEHIVTFDVVDFRNYPAIIALDPASLRP